MIVIRAQVRWEIDRVINPCLAKHGYKEGHRLPFIDITRDCYDAFPIKVQYKEVDQPFNHRKSFCLWALDYLASRAIVLARLRSKSANDLAGARSIKSFIYGTTAAKTTAVRICLDSSSH